MVFNNYVKKEPRPVSWELIWKTGCNFPSRLSYLAADSVSKACPQAFADPLQIGIRLAKLRSLLLTDCRYWCCHYAILEFSEPNAEAGIMGFFARLFIRHVVPTIGALLSGAPREYLHLQKSIKEFPSPNEFVALMEGLSCSSVDGIGAFRLNKLKHLNFGSVQLYLATPIYK